LLNQTKNLFQEYLQFLKKPNPNPNHQKIKKKKKWQILLSFLLIDFLLVLPTSFLIYSIQEIGNINLDNHAVSDLANNHGIIFLLLVGGIITPFIEEIIFRLPLNYKRNYLFKLVGFFIGKEAVKNFWYKYFTVFFYLFTAAFAAVHIFNFRDESIWILILSPLLVLPQIIGGTILGFIRMKLGFSWSFLHHAMFNIILISIGFYTNLEEKVNIDSEDFFLKIEVAENRYAEKRKIEINEDFDFITEIHTENTPYNQLAEKLNWQLINENKNRPLYNITFRIKNLDLNMDSVLQYHLKEIIED